MAHALRHFIQGSSRAGRDGDEKCAQGYPSNLLTTLHPQHNTPNG
jgi:hypothetical protein